MACSQVYLRQFQSPEKYVCPVCHGRKHHAAQRCAACAGTLRVPPAILEPPGNFDEAWARLTRAIGASEKRLRAGSADRCADRTIRRVLVIPDLHVPYHDEALFAEMIATTKGTVDLAICIGDFGEAYALSRFMKYASMPYKEEWAACAVVMQQLSQTYPEVRIILGNHDARLEKQLRTHLTEDMVDAVRYLANGTLCPTTALARGYPNIEIVTHTTPGGHRVEWFTTLGDAWLGHPEKFSRVPGSALRGVEEWLADQAQAMGLGGYRLVVIGHTHQFSMIPWHADTLLVECGCLCQTLGYMTAPRIGGRPQRRGWLQFTQVADKTDLNSVHFHWADVV